MLIALDSGREHLRHGEAHRLAGGRKLRGARVPLLAGQRAEGRGQVGGERVQ